MPRKRARKNASAGKSTKKSAPDPPVDTSDSESDVERTTNPKRVERPDRNLVHQTLRGAWRVHKKNPMCFIFDFVYTARQFERGTKYAEDGPPPTYGHPPYDELTEVDEDGDLAEYAPINVSWVPSVHHTFVRCCSPDVISSGRKYSIECKFTMESFLRWKKDEVAKVTISKRVKVPKKAAAYIAKKVDSGDR